MKDYRSSLSSELKGVSHSPWIPWKWVRRNYTPNAAKPLSALFDAYRIVFSLVVLRRPAPEIIEAESSKCIRCGTCCSTLSAGLTDQERYRDWIASGTLTGLFFREVARSSPEESWYAGWFHNGIRLRICPLLYYCPDTEKHWCAVYHLGPGHRPEACETYVAEPPDCGVCHGVNPGV